MGKEYIYDIIGLGECLIDVIVDPVNSDTVYFAGKPGGAPVNVLACMVKLGLKAGYIGKLSDDILGRYLLETLKKAGISTKQVVISPQYPTTLAMVSLDPKGERSFSFYRNGTSDVMLVEGEIDYTAIEKSRIFHFGSVSMTAEPSRTATLRAAAYAKQNKCLVSYDPNLRPSLWNCLEDAKCYISQGMQYADLVKVSEEELFFLTHTDNLEQGAHRLVEQYPIQLLAVTLGPKGCCVFVNGKCFTSPTYDVVVVDTTGAGDAFWGAFLYQILSRNLDLSQLSDTDIQEILYFANASGALTTTARGAIPALPSIAAIENCITHVPFC